MDHNDVREIYDRTGACILRALRDAETEGKPPKAALITASLNWLKAHSTMLEKLTQPKPEDRTADMEAFIRTLPLKGGTPTASDVQPFNQPRDEDEAEEDEA